MADYLVDVYIKKEKEKFGKLLSTRTVLSYDHSAGILKIPGTSGHPISAAVENVRLS